MFVAVWNAFPNVYRMLDEIVRYCTGLLGFIVTIPISGVETYFLDVLKETGYGRKLIRVDDATKEMFNIWKWLFTQGTLTSENSIVVVLAGFVTRFLYRFTKSVYLLRNILAAKTEEELVQVVVNSLRHRVFLLRIAAIVFGIILAGLSIGFYVFVVGWALFWLSGEAWKTVLPQDSKIIKVKFPRSKVIRKRLNLRTGPDTATGQA